jgi:hypothetical protein
LTVAQVRAKASTSARVWGRRRRCEFGCGGIVVGGDVRVLILEVRVGRWVSFVEARAPMWREEILDLVRNNVILSGAM